MMLHQDGSRHVWIEGWPPMDLIVTLDDATSEIYSMILVEEEGTASTFRALREVIAAHGLFCALYTDRRPLFPHPEGRREGVADAQDPGRPRPGAARHRAHRLLLTPGQGPFGARLPHLAGSP